MTFALIVTQIATIITMLFNAKHTYAGHILARVLLLCRLGKPGVLHPASHCHQRVPCAAVEERCGARIRQRWRGDPAAARRAHRGMVDLAGERMPFVMQSAPI